MNMSVLSRRTILEIAKGYSACFTEAVWAINERKPQREYILQDELYNFFYSRDYLDSFLKAIESIKSPLSLQRLVMDLSQSGSFSLIQKLAGDLLEALVEGEFEEDDDIKTSECLVESLVNDGFVYRRPNIIVEVGKLPANAAKDEKRKFVETFWEIRKESRPPHPKPPLSILETAPVNRPLDLLYSQLVEGVSHENVQEDSSPAKVLQYALEELIRYKSEIERQGSRDMYVGDNPQENIGRALLQIFLAKRSYREVAVRGGRSDILVIEKHGRILYETKIWNGQAYFEQGLREIEEYIIGENSDGRLFGVFYVIFDPTQSKQAEKFCKGAISSQMIQKVNVRIVIVNINLPKPSKKPTNG